MIFNICNMVDILFFFYYYSDFWFLWKGSLMLPNSFVITSTIISPTIFMVSPKVITLH